MGKFVEILNTDSQNICICQQLFFLCLILCHSESCSQGPGKRGDIVADTLLPSQMLPGRLPARNICCGHKFCVRDAKNVSDFVQKHFVSATNVSQFAQPKKHHGQQCVRNNVSSFTRAFMPRNEKRILVYTMFEISVHIATTLSPPVLSVFLREFINESAKVGG